MSGRAVVAREEMTMDLLVVRHARAADRDGLDAHRPLTARGRRDALRVGKAVRHEGLSLDAVISSPLVRAVETAELLAVGADFEEGLEILPALGNGEAPAVIEAALARRQEARALAIVGHEPQLGLILRLLLGQWTPGPRKASCVRLEVPPSGTIARFVWVYHPDMDVPSAHIEDIGG